MSTTLIFAWVVCVIFCCAEASTDTDPQLNATVSPPLTNSTARLARQSRFDTQYDEPFIYECPTGKGCPGRPRVISSIRSIHNNRREDRIFDFSCRPSSYVSMDNCKWSGYLNKFDKVIGYNCPAEGAIVAIASHHSNRHEDRRYNIKCCPALPDVNLKCEPYPDKNYFNSFDKPFTFRVPRGGHINGMDSVHDNRKEDRRFRFDVCQRVA